MDNINDYSDFTPTTDGFTEIDDKASLKLGQPGSEEVGADEKVPSGTVTLNKVDVLLAPKEGNIDQELGLQSVTVGNLADVGFNIKSVETPFVMIFDDVRVLREFIRRHNMFGVKIAELANVPVTVKDRLYEQSVWDLDKVDYPVLLDRVRAAADAQAASGRKDEVRKRMERREIQRVTTEPVARASGERTPAPEDDDGDDFEAHGDA